MNKFNQKGITALSVLLFSLAFILSFLAVSRLFPLLTKKRIARRDNHNVEIVLKGSVDYVANAVNEKWCVNTNTFTRKVCSKELETWVKDTGTLERYLLSYDTVTNLETGLNMRTSHRGGGTHSATTYSAILGSEESVNYTISFDLINTEHPLFTLKELLRDSKDFSGLRISIQRKTSVNSPGDGSEVTLEISVSLTSLLSYNVPTETAVFLYSPVPLHRYALYLANDLSLDSATNADATIPSYDSSIVTNNTGIKFKSDIYIDGKIILPRLDTSKPYTDVSFGGDIIHADDILRKESAASLLTSISKLTNATTYQELTKGSIRGITGVIRHREEHDHGVRVLFDLETGREPDTTLATQCINRAKKYDLVNDENAVLANPNDETLNDACDKGTAFSAVSPFEDFTGVSKHSWNFNPMTPQEATLVFDSGNAGEGQVDSNYQWPVRSVVNKVLIDASARIVAGDIATKTLEIAPRTEPLIIIGTWVVRYLKIDPSAVKSGITWYAKAHPDAVQILIKTKRLGTKLKEGAKCSDLQDGKLPVWHMAPSAGDLNTITSCNVVSLMTADPFNWTKVKPQCGLPKGGSDPSAYTSCNYRSEVHEAWEISRSDSGTHTQ